MKNGLVFLGLYGLGILFIKSKVLIEIIVLVIFNVYILDFILLILTIVSAIIYE